MNLGIFRTRGIGRSIFSFFFYKTVRRTRIKALKFDRVSALPIDCPSQAEVNVVLMNGGDVLGKEGRKALNACVKVKIFGRPQTRLYDYGTTLSRFLKCFSGNFPDRQAWEWFGRGSPKEIPLLTKDKVFKLLLPSHENRGISDIYESLVRFDDIPYVEKYPAVEGTDYDKLKNLIDKRREDVEREVKEATANPDQRHRYSWLVAQRRVRDCFAGSFAGDASLLFEDIRLKNETYCVSDIYQAFIKHDSVISFVNNIEKLQGCERCKMSEEVKKERANVDKEYAEAVSGSGTGIYQQRCKYSQKEAEERVRACYCPYCRDWALNEWLFGREPEVMNHDQKVYDILDICRTLCRGDKTKFCNPYDVRSRSFSNFVIFEKYPVDGPGSAELKALIDAHRTDLEKEYQQDKANRVRRRYTRSEAERRVRDCFAGSFVCDYTDIFASKSVENGEKKIDQTYNIFDIQSAIRYFDSKKLVDKYPDEEGPEADKKRKLVDEERAGIKKEYDEATAIVEIEHGSGFIIPGHFVVTNKHVIESALNDDSNNTQILISNAALGERELPCKIAHYDAGKDLALLYCQDLEMNPIHPLQLSDQPLLPGMQVFSFGFPISHTGDTALFVNGYVSGSKKTPQGHTMAVLNCPLNSGNSGGPVLCWVEGQLKVVGVATQKHFKDILTLSERMTVAAIQEKMQASVIPDVSEYLKAAHEGYVKYGDLPRLGKTSIYLLTLKLYDALETHSQFNLSNALPGDQVIDFLKTSLREYQGDYKDELAKVVETISTSEA